MLIKAVLIKEVLIKAVLINADLGGDVPGEMRGSPKIWWRQWT